MLLRVFLFVLPGAAIWALLPVVADDLLDAGSAGYGLLLGALGAGAVLGAAVLPRLGARLSANQLLVAVRGAVRRLAAGLRARAEPGGARGAAGAGRAWPGCPC